MIDFIVSCIWNAFKAIVGMFIVLFACYGFLTWIIFNSIQT